MTSFFISVIKTVPVSASNQPTLSSMSVTVNPSTEFENMSNLSTISVVTALESLQKSFVVALWEFQNPIGMKMRTISNNLQGLLEECLRESTKDREMLREIVQSTKELLTHNQRPSLLLADTLNNSLIGEDVLDVFGSIENTAEKSCFI